VLEENSAHSTFKVKHYPDPRSKRATFAHRQFYFSGKFELRNLILQNSSSFLEPRFSRGWGWSWHPRPKPGINRPRLLKMAPLRA